MALVKAQTIGTGLRKIAPVYFPDWLAGYLKLANVEETTVVLSSLYLQADLAEYLVLNHLASTISDLRHSSAFEPVLNASNRSPRAGDWYEASVFLSHRFAPDGLRIKVNGKELPVEDGAALIRKRCDTPGINALWVEIQLINPLDNTAVTYTRKYQFEVLPPDSTTAGMN